VVLVRNTQGFHGEVFDGQQKLRAVCQEQIHVLAAELDGEFGVLDIGMRKRILAEIPVQAEPRFLDQATQEIVDLRAERLDGVLAFPHPYFLLTFLAGVFFSAGTAGTSTDLPWYSLLKRSC
jgi:hypothetical protein